MLIPGFVVAFIAAYDLRYVSTTSRALADESAVNGRLRTLLGEAQLAAVRALGGDAGARARFESVAEEIDAQFRLLDDTTDDDEALVDRAQDHWRDAAAMARDQLGAVPAPAPGGPGLVEFSELVRSSDRTLAEVADRRLGKVADSEAAAGQRGDRLLLLFVTLFLASGAVAVVAARRLHRSIAHPLGDLERAAREIGLGELGTRVRIHDRNELGGVGDAFNAMAERLATARRELSHLAFHDALTGLANRSLFTDRCGHALARARRARVPTAVLALDLDHLKATNDTLGHAAGDRLLTAFAHRLTSAVRADDTVARLGGDEFAILLEGIGLPEAEAVALKIVDAVANPFTLGERTATVSATIGVCVVEDGRANPDELIRDADIALYVGKDRGRARVETFDPSMHTALLARRTLELDLDQALARGELTVVYQPIIDLAAGRAVGAEALVRWDHPDRGAIPPSEFVPIAERRGLVVPIGRWVLEQACRQAAAIQERYPTDSPFAVTVNLSPAQLIYPGLVDDVRSALAVERLPRGSLTLDVTESGLLSDIEGTAGVLRELRALGCDLALDDFGTGYSSLAHLHRFPVDAVKIDRVFVERLEPDRGPATEIVEGIVRLAKAMGLATVAEGVERAEQRDALARVGCDRAQGFLWAKPMPVAELDRFVSGSARRRSDAAGSGAAATL